MLKQQRVWKSGKAVSSKDSKAVNSKDSKAVNSKDSKDVNSKEVKEVAAPSVTIDHLLPTDAIQIYNMPREQYDLIEAFLDDPAQCAIQTAIPIISSQMVDDPERFLLTFYDYRGIPLIHPSFPISLHTL